MDARTAKVLASLLFLPMAGGGVAVVHSCGSTPAAAPAAPPTPAEEESIPVFVGSGAGFHFALAPAHPDRGRCAFEARTLRERLGIEGAGFARLFVFRFGTGEAVLDAEGLALEAATAEGESLRLPRLGDRPPPTGAREGLVYRALRGPDGMVSIAPGTGLDFWILVPGDLDLAALSGARVVSPEVALVRRSVPPAEWKSLLAKPEPTFFTGPPPPGRG